MVLATDMAKHFPDLNKLNTMVKAEDFLVNTMSEEDKIFFMSMSVHMADLSNPTKEWLIGLKWAILLYEEFFTQGNTEKKLGIPVGNLTDKPNVNIAKQQVGFMKAIVQPAYEAFELLIPMVDSNLTRCKENLGKWESLINEYEQK